MCFAFNLLKKTDEQIWFFFPASQRRTKILSFAAGKPLALFDHLPLVDLLRFDAGKIQNFWLIFPPAVCPNFLSLVT